MSIQSGVNALLGSIYKSFDTSKSALAKKSLADNRKAMRDQKSKYKRKAR